MPQTFTDTEGRDWIVRVNPVTLSNVEAQLGVSFSDDPEDTGGPIIQIATDCMFCFRVLWILCEKQAIERGVSSEDFGDALVGDTLGKAQKALCGAVCDFYPDQNRRAATARVFSVIREAEQKIVERAGKQLDGLDVDKLVDEVMSNGS